ncbi:hypothetical protein DYB35_008792 [Aphanomyces astaci]|uniref:Uncharacterized protein n=1 Tax=Aphanomyces astaci TaxID=112090 RepID=A0A418DS39_APHAT|nr:hypothetical protein DYB35_008792 [Aphanomyces astaci]
MTVAELEEKKTLLPYLEKIEYINAQLRYEAYILHHGSLISALMLAIRSRGIDIAVPLLKPSSVTAVPPPSQERNQPHDDDLVESGDVLRLESLSSRSETDLNATSTAMSPPPSTTSTGATTMTPLTTAVLHKRYPRFSASIGTSMLCRSRPIASLLRLVDEIYDGYYAHYTETTRATSFPLFVRTHLQRTLGLMALADQESLDLLYNLEMHRETFPHLGVFASFMRELEDEEGALFYAHCRSVVQSTFGLSLKTKEKLLPQDFARQYHVTGAIVVADHPRLRDGTQSVHLSQTACSLLVLRAAKVPKRLANHVASVMLAPYTSAVTVDGAGRSLDQTIVGLDDVLARLLRIFRAVPEDIVLKYKYNDDGESLTLLTRLQDTIHHDLDKAKLKAALDQHVRHMRSLQIEVMKLDRVNVPEVHTKLFLLKNQLRTAERDVQHLTDQLRATDGQINAVWSSVLRDASNAPTTQLSPLDNILARVGEYVAACHRDVVIEAKLKKVLHAKRRHPSETSWASQLDALQERCVIKIQRLYRQRRAWHRERKAALADVEARRQLKHKRKAEKELERKRLDALRDRDAQRHMTRMKEKQRRDGDVQAKLKQQEDAVLKKAAVAESDRRYVRAVATARLVARVFKRWVQFRVVSLRVKYAKKLTLLDKKNQLATRNVRRLVHRRLFKVWGAWTGFVEQQVDIKGRFARCMARCLMETYSQWARLLPRRRSAALTIQTMYRGHTNALLRRMLLRTLSHVFDGFKRYWQLQRHMDAIAVARVHRRHIWCFHMLQAYRVARHLKKAERFRRQFDAATVIQRYFRGFWCRQAFRRLVRRHRSALLIQQTYRRYRHKWVVYEMQRQTNAATVIQCRVRRNKAVAVVTRRRHEFLWQAARRGDYHVVLGSFNSGSAWTSNDEDGNSLLHLACLAGSKRLIKLCLRYGMDINAANTTGLLTPLHTIIATTYPHRAELVDYMIDHGAWHECRDGRGFTPLLLAASLGHVDCIQVLLARAADRNALTTTQQDAIGLATSLNQVAAVASLLEAGYSPNTVIDPADGATLLHECAAHGYVEIAALLIARQANVNAQDIEGNTPAIYAVFNQHTDVLAVLLTAGAAPDIVNVATRSAMHWAVGQADAIRLLADADADVNLRTKDNETPLHLSCVSDRFLESTRALLSYGASVDSKNTRGHQPAHIAARGGAAATMDLLIQYSTNMNARNFDNKNPLGEARMFNRSAVVTVIQRHYADDMKTLDDAGVAIELVDETGVILPTKSTHEWQTTLASSALIQGMDQYKMLRSRIHKVSSETAASVATYRAFWADFTKDAEALRRQTQAAITIQKHFRAYFYHKRFVHLQLQHAMAIQLQRAYRGKIARRAAAHERRRHRCATTIQALVRGFLVRRREANHLHAYRVQVIQCIHVGSC